jgi:hypothetical protein
MDLQQVRCLAIRLLRSRTKQNGERHTQLQEQTRQALSVQALNGHRRQLQAPGLDDVLAVNWCRTKTLLQNFPVRIRKLCRGTAEQSSMN